MWMGEKVGWIGGESGVAQTLGAARSNGMTLPPVPQMTLYWQPPVSALCIVGSWAHAV